MSLMVKIFHFQNACIQINIRDKVIEQNGQVIDWEIHKDTDLEQIVITWKVQKDEEFKHGSI